jgi:hypothetical protein
MGKRIAADCTRGIRNLAEKKAAVVVDVPCRKLQRMTGNASRICIKKDA